MISILPQPYDFDSFEPMSDNYQGTHYSLNPKFEDANIGIGSVISCLLYTSPSPRDLSTSRMPSSA